MVAQKTVGAKAPARIKTLLLNELVGDFRGVQSFVIVCPVGLDAIASNQLRAALTSKHVKMTVVKNSLARLAFEQLDLAPAAELLEQASAVCYGGESVVDVAREVMDWSRKFEAFKVRGAFVEGRVFTAAEVQKLAAMPNRTELLAQVAALIAGPGGRIVSILTSPAARIAGAVNALAERLKEQSQAAVTEAADTKDINQPVEVALPGDVVQKEDAAEPASNSAPVEQSAKAEQ